MYHKHILIKQIQNIKSKAPMCHKLLIFSKFVYSYWSIVIHISAINLVISEGRNLFYLMVASIDFLLLLWDNNISCSYWMKVSHFPPHKDCFKKSNILDQRSIQIQKWKHIDRNLGFETSVYSPWGLCTFILLLPAHCSPLVPSWAVSVCTLILC